MPQSLPILSIDKKQIGYPRIQPYSCLLLALMIDAHSSFIVTRIAVSVVSNCLGRIPAQLLEPTGLKSSILHNRATLVYFSTNIRLITGIKVDKHYHYSVSTDHTPDMDYYWQHLKLSISVSHTIIHTVTMA
jgi:hypothetical protein